MNEQLDKMKTVLMARAFPEHLAKIGIPFDDAYALAMQMYEPPQSETPK